MNAYYQSKRDAMLAKNKPKYNFKNNMPPPHRMPFSNTSAVNFSNRQVMKTPVVPSPVDYRQGTLQYPDRSLTHREGYASAMEPMDCEDWGDEVDFWNENAAHESMPCAANYAPYVNGPPRGSFPNKLMKTDVAYNVHSIPYSPGDRVMEKPLRQSILKVDDTNGLSIKLEKKPQRKIVSNTLVNSMMQEKKLFPKWSVSEPEFKTDVYDKKGSFPRVITVTVEKMLKWPKNPSGSKIIFELYGILESVSPGKYSRSKRIILKSETAKDRLVCTFFEIDRALPAVEKGHWQRCIILRRDNGNYQCVQIRSASANELKNLDKRVISSSKAKALLLKSVL